MSHPTLPVHPIPVAVAPSAASAPVSAQEAAALASRMRVEARLPGVIVVGTTLGLVCGIVTMWPIVRGDDFLVQSMMSFHRSKLLGWMSLLTPLALVGLLLLLAFYSMRLHVQSGTSTFAAVEDNLRKIRRVLAGCMLASLGAMATTISMPRDTAGMVVLGLYAVSCVACGMLVGGVRKGLGEFESREERRRREVIRGFSVELRGGEGAALATTTATTTPPPLSIPPVPAQPVELPPTEVDGPAVAGPGSASAARLPPPIPVIATPLPAPPVATVAAHPFIGTDLAGTQGERDLRTMLHLLATLGIGIYILRSPMLLRAVSEWTDLFNAVALPKAWGIGGGRRGGAGGALDFRLHAYLAQLLIATCGVAWIIWGVVVLSFGARLRLFTLVLAWITVAAVVAYGLAAFASHDTRGFGTRVDSRELIVTALNPHLPELVHGVAMLVLLTRRRVKDLFTVGSEAGEGA